MKRAFKDYPEITLTQLEEMGIEKSAILMVSPSEVEIVFVVDNEEQLEEALKKANAYWPELDYYDMSVLGLSINPEDWKGWLFKFNEIGVNISTPCTLNNSKELVASLPVSQSLETDNPLVKVLKLSEEQVHYLTSAEPYDWREELRVTRIKVLGQIAKGRDYWANLIAWESVIKEEHIVVLKDGRHILYNHELNKEHFTGIEENCEVMVRSLHGKREYYDTLNGWFLATALNIQATTEAKVIDTPTSFR